MNKENYNYYLLGAIIGDISGSIYEGRRRNIRTTDFELKNADLISAQFYKMPNLTSMDLSNSELRNSSIEFRECPDFEVIYVWNGWTKPVGLGEYWIFPESAQIIEK